MKHPGIYDLAGLGIGPFNLGLAALSHGIKDLDTVYFDQHEQFDWHKGMMLPGTTLQVPFYADLVTLADPCNRFSFMAFLKATGRLFHFAIKENNFITRREYDLYCKWVADQLPNLRFNHRVQSVAFNDSMSCYEVEVYDLHRAIRKIIYAKRLVIGVGTVPVIPEFARKLQSELLFHSSDYLFNKKSILKSNSVAIIGSGQSAAEIFHDLLPELQHFEGGLNWFTRSERFFPMEYSKLSLEMTSPDYIEYFYNLPPAQKEELLSRQKMLYKGINFELIGAIYDYLYELSIDSPQLEAGLFTNCELKNICQHRSGKYLLKFFHNEMQQHFNHVTDAVILATSYHSIVPGFLAPVSRRIRWNAKGQYNVHRNYSVDHNAKEIFVQNAELHTHGFNAPDLGMGAYRNSIILNEILGYEHFKIEKNIAFQTFGIPKKHNLSRKQEALITGISESFTTLQKSHTT
ncbi:MAG TPA: SidA/IucD/PvdA family monooxygenase [Chitinophagaceae bacterium]